MVSTRILFGRINIRFSFMDWVAEYTVITVRPGWNMIFFAGEDGTIIAYDLDRKRVRVIPVRIFRHGIKKEFNYRPFYLPYVHLFWIH